MTLVIKALREHVLPQGQNVMQYASYTIIVAAIIQFVLEYPSDSISQGAFVLTLLALGLLFAINAVWPHMYDFIPSEEVADWVFLCASSVLITLAFALGGLDFYPYLLFMLVAQAFTTKTFVAASVLTVMNVMVFYGIALILYDDPLRVIVASSLPGLLSGIVFVITLSMAIRYVEAQRERVERLLSELQQTNAELRASQLRERELAATAERVRLAREIHDGLGHYLTVLNVQLQAAQKLLQRDPQKAAGVIDICRQQAQEALQEVRRSVAVMRQTPLDGRSLEEALETLVSEFDARSPLDARFSYSGEPTDLNITTALTLYRTVQEGLTNAQKHGVNTSEVTVHLEYHPERTCVTIANDGQAATYHLDRRSDGGFGLAGLRERAEQLSGKFRAVPGTDGGFLLEMAIPAKGEPA